MAASEKGYENGLGSASAAAAAVAAARKKGDKMGMGIVWEEKYDEFKRCVEMPEIGTPLYKWQSNQLSNGAFSLNAVIGHGILAGTYLAEYRDSLK